MKKPIGAVNKRIYCICKHADLTIHDDGLWVLRTGKTYEYARPVNSPEISHGDKRKKRIEWIGTTAHSEPV